MKMYINGEWITNSNDKTRTIVSPIDGEKIAEVTEGEEKDVDNAILAARNSLTCENSWKKSATGHKIYILNTIADLIEENAEVLAKIEAINTGRLYRETINDDVVGASYVFRDVAATLSGISGKTYSHSTELFSFSKREPIGVCAIIVPWNYPLLEACGFIASAIATGNSIVVKPSSYTPLTTIKLFEILEKAGLPKGVANLVLGSGNTVGKYLATHPGVDMTVFTGSTNTGCDIMRGSKNIKKYMLELGGKSPMIVFDDVDIDTIVDNIMFSAFLSQGQVCVAGSRLYVHENIYEELTNELIKRTQKLRVGNPINENTQIGPVCTYTHMLSVLNYIKSGIEEGATLACGGRRIEDGMFKNGYYIEPTIFTDCNQSMKIVREEIFGPVLTVQSFKTEEEVIKLANDTKYGLTAQIYTNDIAKSTRIANEIEVGTVWINTYMTGSPGASVTPYKQSGLGTLGGLEGLLEFTKSKIIHIKNEAEKNNWFKA